VLTLRRPAAVRLVATTAMLTALALPLTACTGSSGGPAATASPTRPVTLTGPTAHSDSGGIQVQLPSGWYPIPLGNGQEAALKKLFSDESEIAALSEQMRVGQFRGAQLFAVQPRAGQRPGTLSVSILQASSSTLDSLQKQLTIGTQQVAKSQPVFDHVQLPAGESLRVHYRLNDGDSTAQYYVLAGPLAFTLTVTTPDRTPNLPVDDAVARTLHLSNAA
jgi:hypothetical protein